MVNSLAHPEHVTGSAKRRILVRRCYLNPQAYQRFRPYFNLAGFEIIDYPALTTGGKTSTDIHMVLDIIDLLQREVHYYEFILLSRMPTLHRCCASCAAGIDAQRYWQSGFRPLHIAHPPTS